MKTPVRTRDEKCKALNANCPTHFREDFARETAQAKRDFLPSVPPTKFNYHSNGAAVENREFLEAPVSSPPHDIEFLP
jgi:hypothetical protein